MRLDQETAEDLRKALRDALDAMDREAPGALEGLLTANMMAARFLAERSRTQNGRYDPEMLYRLRVVNAAHARAKKQVGKRTGTEGRGMVNSKETSVALIEQARALAREFAEIYQ